MARPLRIEYPGAVYHLTSRGNRQETIFQDDDDRHGFLEILGRTVHRYNWICHAYCLMGNHYHLLVETPDANVSLGMRQLNGMYTQFSNRRHGKVGHVFQGRFKSILVEKDAHLLELCRYIVLNPVRAKTCDHPGQWLWSSYGPTASGKNVPEFLSLDWILLQFAREKKKAKELYVAFVEAGCSVQDRPWDKLTGQIFLGDERFVEQMHGLLRSSAGKTEIPKKQRHGGRLALSRLIPESIQKDKLKRNRAIVQCHLDYGYTLKEIADHVGIHYTTVSKVISS